MKKIELSAQERSAIEKEMIKKAKRILFAMDVLKSSKIKEITKKRACKEIVEYFRTETVCLPVAKMLQGSYDVLKFMTDREDIEVEDLQDIDFLLKKRVKLFSEIIGDKSIVLQKFTAEQSVMFDKLLELDAKFDIDRVAHRHIQSAQIGEYGDLSIKGEVLSEDDLFDRCLKIYEQSKEKFHRVSSDDVYE